MALCRQCKKEYSEPRLGSTERGLCSPKCRKKFNDRVESDLSEAKKELMRNINKIFR
jgi:transposase-like protein